MPQEATDRVRVILRWIQILDDREPFWQERGEFRFWSRIASDAEQDAQEHRFPETTTWSISDNPAWNKKQLDRVLFEGEVQDRLVVELFGEEIDPMQSDPLDEYRREFRGPASAIVGRYGPGPDTPEDDPTVDLEKMQYWGICYDIEPA